MHTKIRISKTATRALLGILWSKKLRETRKYIIYIRIVQSTIWRGDVANYKKIRDKMRIRAGLLLKVLTERISED